MLDHFLSQVRDQIFKNIEHLIGDSNHIEKAMSNSLLSQYDLNLQLQIQYF